jgi:hypothetical protein
VSLLQEGGNPPDHLARFAVEAVACHADHLYSLQLQVLLAQTVALEGGAAAVGLVDVEFDAKRCGSQ